MSENKNTNTNENNNENNNENKNKRKFSTGNPLLDIGIGVVAAIAGAITGEALHRGSEVRSRNKAKEVAMESNNSAEGE